jgi:hypothetical protein
VPIRELEQLRIFAHYLKVMKFVSDTQRIPNELLEFNFNRCRLTKNLNSNLYMNQRKEQQEDNESKKVISSKNYYVNTSSSVPLELTSASIINTTSSLLSSLLSTFDSLKTRENTVIQTTPLSRDFHQSHLQERVANSLYSSLQVYLNNSIHDKNNRDYNNNKNVKYTVEIERSSFNGIFPVDIAILRNNIEVIAFIEVDGPHHYRGDGSLRRKDKLKEALYIQKHPDCSMYRVRWDEENEIGAEVLSEEIINNIFLNLKKSDNVVVKEYEKLQKKLSNFFCWGLRNSKE